MLFKTEFRILEFLFEDFTKEFSILEISNKLKIPYAQAHRTTKSLIQKKLVLSSRKGNALMIAPKVEPKKEFIGVENEKRDNFLKKYNTLSILQEDLEKVSPVQFICIIFGSYAKKKAAKESDIDLFFIIPEEYNYKDFETKIKTIITVPKTDINITTEKGLLEMWQKPKQLNTGNEILKNHIILKGAEAFFNLRRKYYVG